MRWLTLLNSLDYTTPVTEEKKVTEDEAKIIAEYIKAVVAPATSVTTQQKLPNDVPPALAPVIEKAVAAAHKWVRKSPPKKLRL
ncbi:hypothetical protein AGMMS49975_27550 [Clostridia bacterium]|nr:hypothetical protein AGMMS49975_27550 [Clostridia bacterium]